MNKIVLHIITLMIIMTLWSSAKDSTTSTNELITLEKSVDFVKTVSGYLRAGYQEDANSNEDMALGGKLHIETTDLNGISGAVSFYTTNALEKDDGAGVPFFDINNDSYSILGEVYVQGQWGNTIVKIGRQEIDTPFANTDDNGMILNTFEAAVLANKDIPDTTIVLAQLQKWAGNDASSTAKFTQINGHNNVQTVGVSYEGIEGLSISSWYYRLKDFTIDNIAYIDATYEGELSGFSYGIAAQYALQTYATTGADDASIFGVTTSAGFEGFTVTVAFNKSKDNAADNGFGGGPFFTSANFLTLAEAGSNGEIIMYSAEFDVGTIGIDGLTLSTGIFTLTNETNIKSDELNIGASYTYNDNLSVDFIYSNIDDKINNDAFENIRIFVNYTF